MNEPPIRVLFVVPDLRVGGTERQVTTLLPRMDPARFTPSVVCIGEEGDLFEALPAAGVHARALRLNGKRNALRALRELICTIRRTRPDVVVMVASYNAETLGRIAARVAGVKHAIVWVHNASEIEPRSLFRNVVDRSLTRWTSAYFGVAEAQRPYLVGELGYPADRIRIVHNGVDPALFDHTTDRGALAEFGIEAGDPVVGILGALRPEKDHATLLRAARKVINELPRARFLVIGDGATRAQLAALCAELQITPNVRFAGNRADIGRLLRAIDVFTLSSTTECFPIALLEAMACARPVVCTAVGGVREIVNHGDTGYLVPPKDPEQLAVGLLRLLSDPQTAHRMGRAGRGRVEAEFTIDQSVAAAEQEIEAVVGGDALPVEKHRRVMRHILVLVENLPVPSDRRVWQESKALAETGFKVTVICPAGSDRDNEREAIIEGIRILRYPLRAATGGPLGYVREYALALWHTLWLAVKVRREGAIDVIHACNPPDLLFLIALALRPSGTRFVFDHHDLVPELSLTRFPRHGWLLYGVTRCLERFTFAVADAVISTNESYKRVAIQRGKMPSDRVVVVRSAPEPDRFTECEADISLRRGKRYLLAYLGVMGAQDGVDYALRALQLLRNEIGRDDVHCVFMGAGDAFNDLVALSWRLGVADIVDFVGWVGDEFIQRCLSTADVCLAPEPLNAFNNLSTMKKVVEYMAVGRPIVCFDLAETRASAGDAAVYVPTNDELAFAKAIDALLRDAKHRRQLGESGRRRVEQELSWQPSRRALVELYQRLLGA